MNSVSSRTITSSIHIEPVNSDEYKQNLVEQLTTHHKRKFLEYVRSEPNFLKSKLNQNKRFSHNSYKMMLNSFLQLQISIQNCVRIL